MELWKGNVFSHVCLSFCLFMGDPMWPLLMMHWTSPCMEPLFQAQSWPQAPIQNPHSCAPLLVKSGGQDWRPVQTCSLEDPLVLTLGCWLLKHIHKTCLSRTFLSFEEITLHYSIALFFVKNFPPSFPQIYDVYELHTVVLETWCLCRWIQVIEIRKIILSKIFFSVSDRSFYIELENTSRLLQCLNTFSKKWILTQCQPVFRSHLHGKLQVTTSI